MFKKLTCVKQALLLIAVLSVVCTITAFAGVKGSHRLVIPVSSDGVTDISAFEIENAEVISLEFDGGNLVFEPKAEGIAYVTMGDNCIAAVECSKSGFIWDSVSKRYTGDKWVKGAVLTFVFGAAVIITISLRKQIKRVFFNYSTPLLTGLAILMWMVFAFLFVRMLLNRGLIFENILYDTPSVLLSLTLPVMLIFTIGMFASNMSLLKHEGIRLKNVLGSIIGLALTGSTLALMFNSAVNGSVEKLKFQQLLINYLSGVVLWTECKFTAIIICGVKAARYEPRTDKDYILILGCQLSRDGGMTPLLRGRVERAMQFAKHQQILTGKAPQFIACGGKGRDEIRSEAEAMQEYMIEQGVPKEKIQCEDKSANTWENIKNAHTMMKPGSVAAYATTGYHVFRAGVWAARNDLDAEGMGSKTKWYYAHNAFMREYLALISANKWHEIFATFMIAVQSGLLAYLYQ